MKLQEKQVIAKEKLINAILKLRKSKNATDEQLAIIAERYGVDIKEVLDVAKDREEKQEKIISYKMNLKMFI